MISWATKKPPITANPLIQAMCDNVSSFIRGTVILIKIKKKNTKKVVITRVGKLLINISVIQRLVIKIKFVVIKDKMSKAILSTSESYLNKNALIWL